MGRVCRAPGVAAESVNLRRAEWDQYHGQRWCLGWVELLPSPLMYAGLSGIDTVTGDRYGRA